MKQVSHLLFNVKQFSNYCPKAICNRIKSKREQGMCRERKGHKRQLNVKVEGKGSVTIGCQKQRLHFWGLYSQMKGVLRQVQQLHNQWKPEAGGVAPA
jgi:hypothetical protein